MHVISRKQMATLPIDVNENMPTCKELEQLLPKLRCRLQDIGVSEVYELFLYSGKQPISFAATFKTEDGSAPPEFLFNKLREVTCLLDIKKSPQGCLVTFACRSTPLRLHMSITDIYLANVHALKH